LGFSGVDTVRAGKYIEVWLDADSQTDAESQTDAMCDKLLANMVIEDYRFHVAEAEAAPTGGD
jgi:phosphoribosylformylglycinamidine synthase PurS subunit